MFGGIGPVGKTRFRMKDYLFLDRRHGFKTDSEFEGDSNEEGMLKGRNRGGHGLKKGRRYILVLAVWVWH
jgi:hypothetical protein